MNESITIEEAVNKILPDGLDAEKMARFATQLAAGEQIKSKAKELEMSGTQMSRAFLKESMSQLLAAFGPAVVIKALGEEFGALLHTTYHGIETLSDAEGGWETVKESLFEEFVDPPSNLEEWATATFLVNTCTLAGALHRCDDVLPENREELLRTTVTIEVPPAGGNDNG